MRWLVTESDNLAVSVSAMGSRPSIGARRRSPLRAALFRPLFAAMQHASRIMEAMLEVSLTGKLLVADPRLADRNFERSVVLVLAHGADGALGLVLDRPSETEIERPLPGWAALATPPAVVFAGGPVEPQAVICVAQMASKDESEEWRDRGGWAPVSEHFGTLDLDLLPSEVGNALRRLRIFAGYAGWGPGQLEAEIEVGGWWVLDAAPEDPFAPHPSELWKSVLRRQGGKLALMAAYPADPRLN